MFGVNVPYIRNEVTFVTISDSFVWNVNAISGSERSEVAIVLVVRWCIIASNEVQHATVCEGKVMYGCLRFLERWDEICSLWSVDISYQIANYVIYGRFIAEISMSRRSTSSYYYFFRHSSVLVQISTDSQKVLCH